MGFWMAGQTSQPARRNWRAYWGARPAAAGLPPVLRQVPGSDPLRDRCRPERLRDAAADLWRTALRDLLPVSRNGRRVLRLRAGAETSTGAMAHLRNRAARSDLEEGVSPERGSIVGCGVVVGQDGILRAGW